MDILIQLGIYLGIAVLLIVMAVGGVYFKKKFNIKDEDLGKAEKIISFLSYIVVKGNFKFSGDVKLVTKYVLEAIDFIDKFEDTVSIDDKKVLVENKTYEICKDNGIALDTELVNAVSEIVDFFVK